MSEGQDQLDKKVLERIQSVIEGNRVVLFMKGEEYAPQCGFSSATVQVLHLLKVEFVSVNVLLDSDIREGVKIFSQWPTIPQLYIDGEFVGGCDIVREMFEDGSLEKVVEEKSLRIK